MPGEVDEVEAALADQGAELLHRHRLADVLAVVARLHETRQAHLQALEARRDVLPFQNPDVGDLGAVARDRRRDDQQPQRSMAARRRPLRRRIGVGNHLAADREPLDQPAMAVAQQLPRIAHQLARHLDDEVHGPVLGRLDLAQALADAVEDVVTEQAAAARQLLQRRLRLRVDVAADAADLGQHALQPLAGHIVLALEHGGRALER